MLLAAAAVTALRFWPSAVLALAGALGLAALGRLPPRWLLARLGAAALFLGLFAAPLPFLLHGSGWEGQWGSLRLSLHGLGMALLLFAKGLALLTLMLTLLATAPLDVTLKAAHALHLPGLFVQLATLTYRDVFVVSGEWSRLRVALRTRGYRNRVSRHSFHTLGNVAGTLFVRSYERAERVGQAMRCRGFDGRFRSLARFRTGLADVVAFVLIVLPAAGLLAWDLLQP